MQVIVADGDSALELWRAFMRTAILVRHEMRGLFAPWGITGAQWGVLRVLGAADPEPVMLSQIGQRLLVSSGNVTGVVDRLLEAGYLFRRQDQDDRRVWLAGLTPLGRELYEDVAPAQAAKVMELFGSLCPDEQRMLTDALTRVADHVLELGAKAEGEPK